MSSDALVTLGTTTTVAFLFFESEGRCVVLFDRQADVRAGRRVNEKSSSQTSHFCVSVFAPRTERDGDESRVVSLNNGEVFLVLFDGLGADVRPSVREKNGDRLCPPRLLFVS